MKRKPTTKPTYKFERLQAEIQDRSQSMPLVRWIMLGLLVLGGALCYVRLQAGTESSRAQVGRLEKQCAAQSKALENEKLRQEALTSGRQIRAAVRRMGLNLRSAQTGQVRRMSMVAVRKTRADMPPRVVAAAD